MRLDSYFLGLSLSVVALGCSSSSTATTTIARPELVAVSPEDFLGSLRCVTDADDVADAGADSGEDADSADPGAAKQVRSYVATLFDVTPGADGSSPNPGVQLASSPPTSCLLPVTFSYVVAAHRYLAQIDVFDPSPDDIAPLVAGGRSQFIKRSNVRVTPHSTYTCGGYPATPGDGGSYGGAGSLGESAAGAAGAEDFPPGILSYDGLTQTAHDCREGLPGAPN